MCVSELIDHARFFSSRRLHSRAAEIRQEFSLKKKTCKLFKNKKVQRVGISGI